MTHFSLIVSLLLSLSASSSATIAIVVDEVIQSCVSDEEKAGKFDLSELEIVAADDTHAYLNGSWKFTGDVASPWGFVVYTERYERGKWNLFAFNKKVADFCSVIHRPTEPWYNVYRTVQGCPIKKGTEWTFNMVPLSFPIDFPRNYEGKWRLIQIAEFEIDGVIKKECFIVNFDLIDM